MSAAPYQSCSKHVRFPGAAIAARDLGVHRSHLNRVLSGERQSGELLTRWNAWLRSHPEFAAIQKTTAKVRRAS